MRVALRAGNLAVRVARPRLHIPLPACDGWRRVGVDGRAAILQSRLSAAPRGVVEGHRVPIPRHGAARIVFPRVVTVHETRDHRARRRRKIDRARRATRLRARGPARGVGGVGKRIAFRERDAAAVGRDGPGAVVAVAQLVHRAVVVIAEAQRLAGVAQRAGEGPERAGIHPRRLRQHEPRAGRDDGAVRECEIHAARNAPAGQVHVHAHDIDQLDELRRLARTAGVVVDFVEDDYGVIRRRCVQAGCAEEREEEEGFSEHSDGMASHGRMRLIVSMQPPATSGGGDRRTHRARAASARRSPAPAQRGGPRHSRYRRCS